MLEAGGAAGRWLCGAEVVGSVEAGRVGASLFAEPPELPDGAAEPPIVPFDDVWPALPRRESAPPSRTFPANDACLTTSAAPEDGSSGTGTVEVFSCRFRRPRTCSKPAGVQCLSERRRVKELRGVAGGFETGVSRRGTSGKRTPDEETNGLIANNARSRRLRRWSNGSMRVDEERGDGAVCDTRRCGRS